MLNQHSLRHLRRRRLLFNALLLIIPLTLLEVLVHQRKYAVARPATPLDPPFYTTCQDAERYASESSRENAAIVMLARNADLAGAVHAIHSLESQFNKWFHYPIVFLNDEPWQQGFIDTLRKTASGETSFHIVPSDMWGWPAGVDQKKASRLMKKMEDQGLPYAGKASYRHMCRFNSGMFYDHPALKSYDWYWRIEPDVEFTCAITYDPFVEMKKHNKTYGYTMAIWEVGSTAPSLFKVVSEYKKSIGLASRPLWNSMIDPSWAPWFVRRFVLPYLTGLRNTEGDLWNACHYWSNFEIADLNFFRGKEYRELFRHLDEAGGFYYERWGDAPVHSMAAALFLDAHQVHHFSDIGYYHPPFQYCPQFGIAGDIGCNCQCNPNGRIPQNVCLKRMRASVDPP